jgi:hypothetical protein
MVDSKNNDFENWLKERRRKMKETVYRTRGSDIIFYPLIWVSHFVAPSPDDTPSSIYRDCISIYEILREEYNDPNNRRLDFTINPE